MSIFFNWLQSFCLVKLQCSFPSLCNMEETSKELHYFSIGIDLLGPDPTSNKNKAEKNSQFARFANFHSQLSVNWIKCSPSNQRIKCGVFLTSQQGRLFTFFVRCENFALYHNKRLLHADPCFCSVIKQRALKKLELLSAVPRATLTHFWCSPNSPHASVTQYMHAKHEKNS